MTLKLIIAEDDDLARALIEAIVERDSEVELVGSAEDTDSAIELADEHQPDVALLDWMMPGGGGPVAAREIHARSPETRIVALTTPDAPRAEAADARSSLVKGCPPDELLRTIRAAASG